MSKRLSTLSILHLSDLHFGWGFNLDLWNHFQETAKILSPPPQLIIITGDLVNSPWRWKLCTARKRLCEFAEELKKTEPEVEIIVVPGNHDSRLFGVIPVLWLRLACLPLLAIAAGVWYFDFSLWITWIIFGCLGVSILGGWLAVTGPNRILKDFIHRDPVTLNNLGVQIIPFDSGSAGMRGAQGKIPLGQLTRIADRAKKDAPLGSGLYRIAVLHHHPLPLPYDDKHESLMVFKNAGAFLSEMNKLRVPLVLHGHKHHQHFSRIAINPRMGDGHEIAVLSTGSPTAGKVPDRFGFGFHHLKLSPDDTIKVTPYTATEGTFEAQEPFDIETDARRIERRYLEAKDREKRYCDLLNVFVGINEDGDAYSRREYSGLRLVDGCELLELPDTFIAFAHGHIEEFIAQYLSGPAPGLKLDINDTNLTLNRQEGKISFGGRKIESQDEALSFVSSFYGANAYAMNGTQYREMYGGNERPFLESVIFRIPSTPIREATFVIKFPNTFNLMGEINIEVTRPGEMVGRQLSRRGVICLRSPGLIMIPVQFPESNSEYRVRWSVPGDVAHVAQGRVQEIADALVAINKASSFMSQRMSLLTTLKKLTLETLLKLAPEDDELIDIAIMAYDLKNQKLLPVFCNYNKLDVRMDWTFKYGDGVAGRAYKTAKWTFFRRDAMSQGNPHYYLRGDDKPVRSPADVPESAVLAVPLGHPDDQKNLYGVLRVTSTYSSSRLTTIGEDRIAVTEFCDAANITCFDILNNMIKNSLSPN